MRRKIAEEEIEEIVTKNRLINSENNLSRLPLEREKRYFDKIRQGKYREVHFMDLGELEQWMGQSTKDKLKMFEYIAVAAISMGARTAIEGGMPADAAFDLSDAMLQRLEKARTLEEMHEIIEMSGVVYAHEVLKSKMTKNSYLIEQSKNYISSHIFKKISLKQIAEYVGVTPEYLSAVFSKKEKCTIQQYIQKEKMQIACNMLRYSEQSISEISQYIGYQSQSNFAAIFKKWIGQTPSQYREENRMAVYSKKM